MPNIHIIGGGTVFHIRNHLSLSAPAYGRTARSIEKILYTQYYKLVSFPNEDSFLPEKEYKVFLNLTKMADANSILETNEDVSKHLDIIINDPETKIVFMNAALVDYEAYVCKMFGCITPSGKYETRLKTSDGKQLLYLKPSERLISKIRKIRKDIFLVGFKTTCGATEDEQFIAGLQLLKTSSCNLVLANDTKTRMNMIITPEQARYSVTNDRSSALTQLVEIALRRSRLNFTRSEIKEGAPVAWNSPEISDTLRTVVNYCIEKGAYKPFLGATVGHFAAKVNDKTFLTSRRKTNFNNLNEIGLVKVESTGDDSVIAYGSRPSVGGMSQRIIFREHPEMNSIVHFHCPPKPNAKLSVKSQKFIECGSHECGKNTSNGLKEIQPGIKCVYLDNHGPNIVFNSEIDPNLVIKFIEENFDLSQATDQIKR